MNKGLVRNRVVLLALAAGSFACASVRQADYATPEEAMQVLADVVETGDHERADQLFGADGRELLRSGDEVADREDAVRVKAAIREKLTFADHGDGAKLALIGNDEWPFPIPLVQDGARWRFDVEAGVEELENRRIGRNELSTIATMHEYVDAQREYHALPRDGQPPAYAQKLLSSPGQHDGLFWPVEPGQPESPMGPFVAEAQAEGYSKQADEPAPEGTFKPPRPIRG